MFYSFALPSLIESQLALSNLSYAVPLSQYSLSVFPSSFSSQLLFNNSCFAFLKVALLSILWWKSEQYLCLGQNRYSLFSYSHKAWHCITREPSLLQGDIKTPHEIFGIRRVECDCCRSSLSVIANIFRTDLLTEIMCLPRKFHAVYDSILHTRKLPNMVSYLACTHILSFPPKSVSHPVIELDPPRWVPQ